MKIGYPLKFNALYQEKPWGGDKLVEKLNKNFDANKLIGESWELSGVQGFISIVNNGELKGKNLNEIISEYKEKLLGHAVYKQFGNNFPLLIKFLDARKNLSVQVHPDNKLAGKRHSCFGKTEMWYVLDAKDNAKLVAGTNKTISQEEYLDAIETETLVEKLNHEYVKPGDSFFIPAGNIHAICSGILLAEIQQCSNITYRLYDWDTLDIDGNKRELHIEDAKEAINLEEYHSKQSYDKEQNKHNNIVSCEFFKTNYIPLRGELQINNKDKDSFIIYMCTKGKVSFIYKGGIETLSYGETLLIPASLKEYIIKSEDQSELLEVYI